MIRHVRITNFKSLADVSVHLDEVTVLIGRSGTGKSNFVDALRFLREFLAARSQDATRDFGGWERILPAGSPGSADLGYAVAFDAPGIEEPFEYTLVLQDLPRSRGSQREEKLSLGGRVLFHQDPRNWIQPPALIKPPDPGQVALSTLTGIPEISLAHQVLAEGVGCYAFSDQVLVHPGPGRPPEQYGLADNGDNFLQVYRAITQNLQAWSYPRDMAAALQRLNPSVQSVDFHRPGFDRLLVGHQVDGRILVLELAQESEGFRRFLAHLIAMYQIPPKQTLVFEQPEKGIHPGALAPLTDQYKACPQAGRGQVILTTHSPELLDHFEPERIRVVEMRHYATAMGPLHEDQKEAIREQLLRPGELLTVDGAMAGAN
jgi:predicted ATPase